MKQIAEKRAEKEIMRQIREKQEEEPQEQIPEKILLIGVECDYVEVVDGARPTGVHAQVVMDKTPDKNPNYWFDDYQQKGDMFNLPQAEVFHRPAWERLSVKAPEIGVEIINCSSVSKLDCFKKSTLKNEL